MAEALTPTLEDLREGAVPAWLWDGVRARIVWANPPGVAFFGGESLFDLIDRPFDAGEAGVERIMALNRSLRRGQVETAHLHFPSAGTAAALTCRCTIHALTDGRPGLLAVAAEATPERNALPSTGILAAFDLLPSAAGLIGRDGSILHLNAAALLLLGALQRVSLAALMGDVALAEEFLTRTEAAGTASMTGQFPARTGQRDLRLTLRKLALAEDGPYALLLADDITERRALERRLSAGDNRPAPGLAPAEAEAFKQLGKVLKDDAGLAPKPEAPPSRRSLPAIPQLVRATIDRLPDAVLIAKDGQLRYANPSALRLFGYNGAEDVINDTKLWERFVALGQSLPTTEIEYGNGQSLTATAQMSVVPWLGGPARQFVIRPIAEPQAEAPLAKADSPAPPAPIAETQIEPVLPPIPPPAVSVADEELRAILDTATDGIITLDAQGNVHTFSAGAEAIFGYRIAEVADKPFAQLLAPESRKVLRDYLSVLQGPGVASVFNDGREVTAVVKQGGTVPLFLTLGKLQAPNSRAAFCAVVRDITQWKKTETELRDAKEAAEATSRQKSEFLARISHELRTPLNAIMGFSEVMRLQRFGEIGNEKYRGYVNDIHASGGHLLSLINDLLDLSKVEAGKLELNFTSVNLGEITDHAIRMLQEQATAARVVLRKALAPDLPNVVADLRSMRQIMLNLLSNALKFTDPGGQVIVSAQMTQGGELKLRVKDTGIGMSAEQLRDALEPFRRVVTDGRDTPGTGLGLPLTKALAEANRTKFEMTSEARKGTLVEITFPTTRVLAE